MAKRPSKQAEMEAAHWLVVLDEPNVAPSEIERFQAWLAADDDHKRAYEAVSASTDKLEAFLRVERLVPANDVYVDEDALRRRKGGVVGAVVLAAALAGFGLIATFASNPSVGDRSDYAASTRQAEIVTLPDGSRVELAPGARIIVSMSPEARQVRLEDGVALFVVAHDSARPFEVTTRFGDIRVTGTEFVVRLDEDRVLTTVLSGRVEARRPSLLGRTEPDAVGVANTEIVLDRTNARATPINAQTLERRLIWRERMVALDGQSLREATAEIERFTGVRFVFADEELAETRLSGYVAGDDVEAFLALLRSNVGIDAERHSDGVIHLRRRAR